MHNERAMAHSGSLTLEALPDVLRSACAAAGPFGKHVDVDEVMLRFASEAECDDLIKLGESRLRLSEMGAAGEESDDGDGDNLASSRTSSSVFFDDPADAEQPLLQRLRAMRRP